MKPTVTLSLEEFKLMERVITASLNRELAMRGKYDNFYLAETERLAALKELAKYYREVDL